MTGIFGIINFDGKPVMKSLIANTLEAIPSGNCDHTGTWVFNNAGFGQTTSWTTPETKLVRQPLVSRDGSLVIIADARLDNRDELIQDLAIKVPASAISDVELILHAYIQWHSDCVNHFFGDFSFVIFNSTTGEIFIARDHLGFRPLYYLKTKDTLAFCSSIQPLLKLGLVSSELDNTAFDYSLLFDALPKQQTYYKNIYRFIGGTYTILKKNELISTRYWHPEAYSPRTDVSFNDVADEFLETFGRAVNDRLRSSYPLGFELSGGLDSSSVTLMANKLGVKQSLQPLSLRFGSMQCDEGQFIQAALKRLERPAIEVRADKLDYENVHSLQWFYNTRRDWPADLFFIPHLVLAMQAQDFDIKIILTGQGGDEVMQGSRWIYFDYLKKFQITSLINELSHSHSKKYDTLRYLIRPLLSESVVDAVRYLKNRHIDNSLKRAIKIKMEMAMNLSFRENDYPSKSNWDTARMLDCPEAALWRDSNPYTQYRQFNIEVAHPFFDIRLIALRLSSPASYFYGSGQFKLLLRNAMKATVPQEILMRQDKANFNEMIMKQLSASKTNIKLIHDTLQSVISPDIWQNRKLMHAKRGFQDHEELLDWKLLNMYCWIRTST